MSNLSVAEFAALGRDLQTSPLPSGKTPAIAIQNVSFTGTAGTSSAFNAETRFIRVYSDADCRILIGSDPTATLTDILMAADQAEYFGVTPGHKISAIEVA